MITIWIEQKTVNSDRTMKLVFCSNDSIAKFWYLLELKGIMASCYIEVANGTFTVMHYNVSEFPREGGLSNRNFIRYDLLIGDITF